MRTLEVTTRGQWRRWLEKHHAAGSEVWLVFRKKHTGAASLPYEDSVEEALCFGWIDSLVRRLDEDRYARKYTPRRPGSSWSEPNKRRALKMIAAGRMTAPGLALVEHARQSGEWHRDRSAPPGADVKAPAELTEALNRSPRAATRFETLAPSHRRRWIGWVAAAKKPETRRRRADEVARKLASGRELGLK